MTVNHLLLCLTVASGPEKPRDKEKIAKGKCRKSEAGKYPGHYREGKGEIGGVPRVPLRCVVQDVLFCWCVHNKRS